VARVLTFAVEPVEGKSKMTESELWEWMMDGNYPPGYPDMDRPELCKLHRRAFATLSRDVVMEKWRGHGAKPEYDVVKVPAGTKVNVVMASRMGDVGITDNLKAKNGYHRRTTCVESEFMGEIFQPAGLLLDIEPIEDPRADKVLIAFPNGS